MKPASGRFIQSIVRRGLIPFASLAFIGTALAAPQIAVVDQAHPSTALSGGSYVQSAGFSVQGTQNLPGGLVGARAIATSNHIGLAIKADQTVVGWGQQGGYQSAMPANLTNVIAVATSGRHNLALKSDGTVVAWGGANSGGELNVPANLTNVVSIGAGGMFSVAVKGDGTVVEWGQPILKTPCLRDCPG